jgi:hypothetical protein
MKWVKQPAEAQVAQPAGGVRHAQHRWHFVDLPQESTLAMLTGIVDF